MNHFSRVCQSRVKHAHEVLSDSDSIQSVEAIALAEVNSLSPKVMASMNVCGGEETVQFHVDTGSSVNVLPRNQAPADIELQPTNTVLKSWTGDRIRPMGECRLVVRNPKNNAKPVRKIRAFQCDAILYAPSP